MNYYRLDIDVAVVLKLLLTNENISKDNARRSKLAMNTP